MTITFEVKDGKKYVQLRNPWGESEPSGNGANDGIFKLKLDDFAPSVLTLHRPPPNASLEALAERIVQLTRQVTNFVMYFANLRGVA